VVSASNSLQSLASIMPYGINPLFYKEYSFHENNFKNNENNP
jgi:hypothetical protein